MTQTCVKNIDLGINVHLRGLRWLIPDEDAALQGSRSEANLVNHDVTAEQSLTELVDGLQKPCPHQLPILRVDTQQDQAWNGLVTTKHKLAEILVIREEKTSFSGRQSHDFHSDWQ